MMECKIAQNRFVVRTSVIKRHHTHHTHTHIHTHTHTHIYIYIYICRFSAMFGGGKKYSEKKTVSFKPTWNKLGFKTDLYGREPRLTTEPSLSVLCKTKSYMCVCVYIYIYIYIYRVPEKRKKKICRKMHNEKRQNLVSFLQLRQ